MNGILVAGGAGYIILEAAANILYFDYEDQPPRRSWRWYLFQYGRVGRLAAGLLILAGAFWL